MRVPLELTEVESAPCREVVFENPASYLLTRTTAQPPPPLRELPHGDKHAFLRHCKKVPAHITCPRCYAEITTEVKEEMGLAFFLVCFALLVCGCGIGILVFPFFSQKTTDHRHSCPLCLKTIHVDKVL